LSTPEWHEKNPKPALGSLTGFSFAYFSTVVLDVDIFRHAFIRESNRAYFCICSEVSSGSEEAEIDEDGVFKRKGLSSHSAVSKYNTRTDSGCQGSRKSVVHIACQVEIFISLECG